MITIDIGPGQFARTRFAVSRLAELSSGLEALVHPERAPYARRWVAQTRRRLDPAAVGLLLSLVDHASWYVPDFLVPVPEEYEPCLETEIAAVAETPAETVCRQLVMAFRIGEPPAEVLERVGADTGDDPRAPLPAALADVLQRDGGAGVAKRAGQELEHCWSMALSEIWPAQRRILDEDVRERSAAASKVGVGDLLSDLHPMLAWDGAEMSIRSTVTLALDAAPGLVLTPSVFLHRPALWVGASGRPMVGYPARGRGQVWAEPDTMSRHDTRGARPADLLGMRRAALLADLSTPRSTAELAERHQLSAATVSYHLGRLHKAGLVSRRQAGHAVLYTRTTQGATVLTALDGSS